MLRLLASRIHPAGLKPNPGLLCSLTLLALLAATSQGLAGTVVSGDVGGVWDLPGSPYWVEGDLVIPADSALTIQPGVQIRFRGPYRFLVNGALYASGTVQDSIVFTWDSPAAENEWRGLRFVRSDGNSILEYCRIERARSADQFPEVRGGGLYCHLCSLTVRHSLIQYNVSHNGNFNGTGGGVVSVNAWPLVESCTIRDNQSDSGGGIAFMDDQSDTSGYPIARNNLISDNIAQYCGGGIYVGAFSTPVIENNIVSDNLAGGFGGGGIALWNTNSLHPRKIDNNIVSGNWTNADGGGFYIRYDCTDLVNNTIVENSADSSGGGVYVLNYGGADFPHLRNTIIWGNVSFRDSSVGLLSASTEVEVAYSDVEHGWPGTGNIDQNPLLADSLFHLAAGSPCVDAGDPDGIYDDQCFPPSQGTERNDIGAYGGPLGCGWPQDCAGIARPEGDGAWSLESLQVGNCPNPFNHVTELRFDLDRARGVDLAVFDVRGRQVRHLIRGAVFTAGPHTAVWDGCSDSGTEVPPGVYLCRIQAEGLEGGAKMMLLK